MCFCGRELMAPRNEVSPWVGGVGFGFSKTIYIYFFLFIRGWLMDEGLEKFMKAPRGRAFERRQ